MKIKINPLPKNRQECYELGFEHGVIQVTALLVEHPENWDGPCACEECFSDGGDR